MLNVAVIGLGDVSKVHLPLIKEHPAAKLVAVCDIEESLKGSTPDANFYTDYMEMLDQEDLDCVHICLPHYLHSPVTKACVMRGINVYLEKPLSENAKEAEKLVNFVKGFPGVKVCVSLQNRLNDSFVELKKIVQTGSLGKVIGIKGLVTWFRPKSYYDSKPWRGSFECAGGGVMINQSIHTLDQMQVIGGKIVSIRGFVDQLVNYGYDVEDTAVANIKFQSGATGLFFATTTYAANSSVELQVLLEKGKLTIKDFILYKTDPDGERVKIAEDSKLPSSKFYYGASHRFLIDRFYRAIINNTADYINVEEALKSMRIIDAIERSSKLHIPIDWEDSDV